MVKIKGIVQDAKVVLKHHKEEANFYLKQIRENSKEIKRNAKYKVNDILKNVSV